MSIIEPEKPLLWDAFLKKICEQRNAGFGFVPLIGAGASVASGIPIIKDIHHYLANCIARCLDIDGDGMSPPWTPQNGDWPSLVHARRPYLTIGDMAFRSVEDIYTLLSGKGNRPENSLYREAAGATVEWRSALSFLARVHQNSDGAITANGTPNADVIDSFFRHIIRDKVPNGFHHMLAQLSDLLRFKIILTTNFDDLIERAYRHASKPITEIPVHIASALPPLDALGPGCNVIKLHGGRYGLRADHSLDSPPSDEDKKRFATYLLGGPVSEGKTPDNHLLIMGSSAADRRLVSFLQAVPELIKAELQVFWVCYSVGAMQSVSNLKLNGVKNLVTRYRFLDLMLHELYQRLLLQIPPQTAIFPSVPNLAVPPDPASPEHSTDRMFDLAQLTKLTLDDKADALREFRSNALHAIRQIQQQSSRRAVVLASKPEVIGVTSTAASLFYELHERNICVWIDLDDICDADDIFEQIIHSIALKVGIQDWLPVILESDERKQEDELAHITRDVGKPIIVFLNAREGAGTSFAPESKDSTPPDNGWIDRSQRVSGSRSELDAHLGTRDSFIGLISQLTGPACRSVTVVILCNDTSKSFIQHLPSFGFGEPITLPKSLRETAPNQQQKTALYWVANNERRARFLLGLCLMRRIRHFAVPYLDICLDNANANRPDVAGWMDELGEKRVLLNKPGGFVWIHRRTRDGLRAALCKKFSFNLSDIHKRIARWYKQVFLSSQDPYAALESVFHFCECALAAEKRDGPRILRSVYPEIRWVVHLLKDAVLGKGYSRGICRRITQLRCITLTLLRDRVTAKKQMSELELDLLHVMRALAREVAENETAFRRHRQIRELTVRETIQVNTDSHYHPDQEREIRKQFDQKRNAKWLDWQREAGTLAVGTRSYLPAEQRFRDIYRYHITEAGVDCSIGGDHKSVRDYFAAAADAFANCPSLRGPVLATIRRHLQLLILRGQIARMKRRFVQQDKRDSLKEESKEFFDTAQYAIDAYHAILEGSKPAEYYDKPFKKKTLNQVCGYLQANRRRMHYDEYLAKGYPIASGVIEGACRHLVKDRMERAGMHWKPEGAQAMLDVRSIYIEGAWDQYQTFRIARETQRLYPLGPGLPASGRNACASLRVDFR